MKKGGSRYRPSGSGHGLPPASEPIRSNNTPELSNPSLDRSMVRWTRVVGAFTAFLAIVAGLQFWAFIQSERAFLSVAGLTINGGFPQAGDPSVRVFVQVKNSGRNIASLNTL